MIRVLQQALTELQVDAVIRPVRSDFAPMNAVGRDLGTGAGRPILDRLERLGSLPIGGAVMTPAGELPCDFLIHVVVMSEDEPQTPASVRRAVENGLRRAADMGIDSVAMPPLGIGAGLTEPEVGASDLLGVLRAHLARGEPPLDIVIVVSSSYEADLFLGLIAERANDPQTGA